MTGPDNTSATIDAARAVWTRYRAAILYLAVALMTVGGAIRLSTECVRLVAGTEPNAAIDLRQRYQEVRLWFSGEPVYSELGSAVYPPASYAMMRPFLDWQSYPLVRWMWAAACLLILMAITAVVVRESLASTRLERAFVALIPLSIYATSVTIGNGQLTLHIVLLLTLGLILMHRKVPTWTTDLLIAASMGAAMVKPTLTAPFFFIVLFIPGRLQPAVLLLIGYGLMSIAASVFQAGDIVTLHLDWLQRGIEGAAWGSRPIGPSGASGAFDPMGHGYGNVHSWLGRVGLASLNMPISLFILAAAAFWTYRHRTVDIWLVFGVTALVARLWTYHRVYDDLLILLPMVALFRIVKREQQLTWHSLFAGVLLAATLGTALMPASLLVAPRPWSSLFASALATTWCLTLVFLLYISQRETTDTASFAAVHTGDSGTP